MIDGITAESACQKKDEIVCINKKYNNSKTETIFIDNDGSDDNYCNCYKDP